MNLATVLTHTATRMPHRVALRLGESALSYSELDDASARVAALLEEHSVGPGDRVGVMLPNVPEFAAVYYGVLRAGGVVVPMNPLLEGARGRLLPHGLRRAADLRLARCGHEAVLGAGTAAREVVEAVEVDPATFPDTLTSHAPSSEVADRAAGRHRGHPLHLGHDRQPKGAELTHGNLLSNAEVVQSDLVQLEPDDVVFGGLPLFHSFGQTCTLNAAIAAGATPRRSCRASTPHSALAGAAPTTGSTVFAGVPTMYGALPGAAGPPRRLSATCGCASPAARRCRSRCCAGSRTQFGCMVLEGYGLSETSPVASFNRPDRDRKPGSIGTPDHAASRCGSWTRPASRVATGRGRRDRDPRPQRDEGLLAQARGDRRGARRGRLVPHRRHRRVDEDGYYFIVDRKKDLIIRGGFNIYPREIEEVLYEHPAVAEAAVVGVPHPELGEEVAAAVTLKPDVDATEDELRGFVKRQVAPYKYPRVVRSSTRCPRDPPARSSSARSGSAWPAEPTGGPR